MFSIPKNPNIQAPGRGPLGGMEIFRRLPKETLREIEAKVVERKFPKGTTILLEGEPADRVWFVKEGHIKAMTQGANGRTQTLCMVGQNGMFGSCCTLGGGHYPCHVEAETDVTAVSLPMADFKLLMERHPQVSRALAEEMSRKLNESKKTQSFDQESVEKRILHNLIGLVREFGNTIPLTRREIAEMAGTTVETSIRTFSKLEADQLVSTTRGRITVKDVALLVERLEKI